MLTMTNCPPRLRGDLSKWLCEINTELEERPEATVKSRYRYAIQHIQQRLRKEKSI